MIKYRNVRNVLNCSIKRSPLPTFSFVYMCIYIYIYIAWDILQSSRHVFTFTHYFSIFIKIFHKSIKSAHVILHNSLRHACIHSFGGTGEMMDGMRNEWKIEKKKKNTFDSKRTTALPCLRPSTNDLKLTFRTVSKDSFA